ncbi:MAG TPA: amidohydrolase family protein, partial [Candidatus Limnocylindria bacterium]|nr:amidohydrolase family protein [Candidatus Limnocylindria bacterium]
MDNRAMAAPDFILHGGTVITLDRGSRIVEAIAVRGERIAAVGDAARLLADAAPQTRVIDLRGRAVVPGFCDAHPHVDREGLKRRGGI